MLPKQNDKTNARMLNIMTQCEKRQATTLTTIMTLFSQSLFPARLPALYVSPKSEKRRNSIETKLMWCLKYVYFANSARWKKRATRSRVRKQEVGVGVGEHAKQVPTPSPSRFLAILSRAFNHWNKNTKHRGL